MLKPISKKKKDVIVSETSNDNKLAKVNLTSKLLNKIIFNLQVLLTATEKEDLYAIYLNNRKEYLPNTNIENINDTNTNINMLKENKELFYFNLTNLLQTFLTKDMVLAVSEERNSKDYCGYPLCMNILKDKNNFYINKSYLECCTKKCINNKESLIRNSEFISHNVFYMYEKLRELNHICHLLVDNNECKQIVSAICEAINPFKFEDSYFKLIVRKLENKVK